MKCTFYRTRSESMPDRDRCRIVEEISRTRFASICAAQAELLFDNAVIGPARRDSPEQLLSEAKQSSAMLLDEISRRAFLMIKAFVSAPDWPLSTRSTCGSECEPAPQHAVFSNGEFVLVGWSLIRFPGKRYDNSDAIEKVRQ